MDIAFSPDGKWLASASEDKAVKVWDITTGQCRWTTPEENAHAGAVFCVAFSPDGKWVASGGHGGTMKIWEARSGRWIRDLSGHDGWVWDVTFSPDSTQLASACTDRTV